MIIGLGLSGPKYKYSTIHWSHILIFFLIFNYLFLNNMIYFLNMTT
jgi:hypothetical protein